MSMKQYRHGDLLIVKIDTLPAGAKDIKSKIVEEGEETGHFHQLSGDGLVYEDSEQTKYIQSNDDALTIVHEEHNPINLPTGVYKVTRQREYDTYEQASRVVQD